jgi:hypothetical protein
MTIFQIWRLTVRSLPEICQILNDKKIPYALIGGYAVALHGAIRGTVDIDFITKWNLKNLTLIEKAFLDMGLVSQLPINAKDIFNFRDEFINNKNLKAWNFYNPQNPLEQIDLIIIHDLDDYKVKKIKSNSGFINILDIDDLIKMKQKSGRPQDLEDVLMLKNLRRKKIAIT